MQLLCLGDIALADRRLDDWAWMPPGGLIPSDETRILINWELPIGNIINPIPRASGSRLLSHPDSVNVISKWAPGFATLATNHILDAGEDGLANTINSLHQAGFITIGSGMTKEQITKPHIWETSEGKLAILNWVFPETHPDWMCMPGPNCWPGIDEARNVIRKLKQEVDWVMVLSHWSDELFPYPRPEDRIIASELADSGADILVSHHPHVVRGMEFISSCLVFYSLGNFYFSDFPDGQGGWISHQSPRNREGLGVEFWFRKGKVPEYKVHSFWQTKRWTKLDPLHRATRRMVLVSRPLQRYQNTEYTNFYKNHRIRFDRWGYRLHFGLWKLGRSGLKRKLLSFFH